MALELYYASLSGIFLVIIYMMIIDPNVSKFILLLLGIVRIQIQKIIFLVKIYPRLCWDKFMLKRRAKALLKTLESSNESK